MNKIFSFAQALAQHMLNGSPKTPDIVMKYRQYICNNCDKRNAENNTCLECGCYLDIKINWADQECPIGKWKKSLEVIDMPKTMPPCGGCGS